MKRHDDSRLSARGKAAAAALADLQKAVRFHRLYPPTHRLCVDSVGEACAKLGQFLGQHGALELEVLSEGIALDGELVLRDSEQSTDLSALLHPEGIRELTIEPGIEAQELSELVQVLAAHYTEGDDGAASAGDLLTHLWRRDLPHVDHRIVDQLAPAVLTGAPRAEEVASIAQRIGSLADELSGARAGGPVQDPTLEGLDVDRFLAALEPGELVLEGAPAAARAVDPARGAERRALHGELEAGAGALPARALDVVLWALARPEAGPAVDDAAGFVAAGATAALGRADLRAALALLDRLGDEGPLAAAVKARLSTEQGLGPLAAALDARRGELGAAELHDLGARLLDRLGPGVTAAVCKVYPATGAETARRVFREHLAARLEANLDDVAALLRSSDRRVAEDAARLLAGGGRGGPGWQLLEEAAEDASDPARCETARAVLDDASGERARRERVRTLQQGAGKPERLAALEALRASPGPRLFDELLPAIQDPEFGRRDEDEVEAFLDALVQAGGIRAVRTLQELTQRRTLLFGRKETQRASAVAQRHLDALRGRRREEPGA